MAKRILIVLSCLAFIQCGESTDSTSSGANWSEYLGGPDRNHYSTLDQINAANVDQLRVAWEYHTGDSAQIQCNPLIVDGVLYGMTASAQPFALDAATGKEIWRRQVSKETSQYNVSRGLTYWEKEGSKRILFTNGEWLYAVNSLTGTSIPSFGDSGRVSLKSGLGASAKDKFVISTTPGTTYENLIIMPLRVNEGPDAALGHIQAFNIMTGKPEWVFHTIPYPGEKGHETWPADAHKNTFIGGANNWAGMAIDRPRGIVFVPTGSAAFDYYGGNRKGQNLYANTLLALDAKSGKLKWHFQFVHHDILDRDAPAAPNLVTIQHNGKKRDVVVQVTKQAFVFMFDRETGESIFPIEERPVPASDVPGEEAWPTQPFPTKPVPFARQNLSEDELSPYAENKEELLEIFRATRHEGPFTPLAQRGTLVFPGLDGGAEWGGAATDTDGVLYVNSSEMAWLLALGPAKEEASGSTVGEALYFKHCSVCHGKDRKGNPAGGFPALSPVQERFTRDHLRNVITAGLGRMPGLALPPEEVKRIVDFVRGEEKSSGSAAVAKEPGLDALPSDGRPAFRISKFTRFLDNKGLPAISPPWGTLNAIDLNTGEYRWKIPFGEYPELMEKGIPQTGSESYGGPVVTASGLLFIAGTKDKKFRVYNKQNGKLLWETVLPAAGFATPGTYMVNGKQYVVIACGGGKLGAPAGDSYLAFAIP